MIRIENEGPQRTSRRIERIAVKLSAPDFEPDCPNRSSVSFFPSDHLAGQPAHHCLRRVQRRARCRNLLRWRDLDLLRALRSFDEDADITKCCRIISREHSEAAALPRSKICGLREHDLKNSDDDERNGGKPDAPAQLAIEDADLQILDCRLPG